MWYDPNALTVPGMLKTLAMRGFRGFESYGLNDLTRVNLIVGKNNSGKTTVLEAVELLVSNGHLAAFAWNDVIAEGREDEIAGDMRLLVPEIASIHFLTSSTLRGSTALVGLRRGGRRMPIGSYGDGLRRLLALRLALHGANHGFLLIDEIDAGLHWTVMEGVWRLLVEVAKDADAQIFATTHSQDCIR